MSGAVSMVEKPAFTCDQVNRLTDAAKKFGELRRKAKIEPQIILDNGSYDLVLLDYKLYERLVMRIGDLEDQIVAERIEAFDKDPSGGVPFDEVLRRAGLKE